MNGDKCNFGSNRTITTYSIVNKLNIPPCLSCHVLLNLGVVCYCDGGNGMNLTHVETIIAIVIMLFKNKYKGNN